MSTITCPACHHAFDHPPTATDIPDQTVVQWLADDPNWAGPIPTAEAYRSYLRSNSGTPASREQFVASLAHLGIEQVLDDDTYYLLTH